VPASTSPEPVQGSVPAPTPWSRDRSIPSGAGKQKRRSLRAEAGGARPKRLRRPVTIVVPTYGFAQQAISLREEPSRRNGVKRETFCAMAKAQQARICGKLEEFIKESDDYKSPLSYYPKEAKGPQASPCQNRLQEERQGGCQEPLAREILAFPSPA
jgi:hypothetical protein